ncbi:MAG TPA: heparan-alpha-glucosaminide N-acetyltransferase domain-containing protein, partial [Chitinophagaceae bacterium]|nr:heparan-alpha-glucosaminide N-acetyltransferase domain-containing protein [Chitinophagaceae bacterium]
MKQRFYSLDVFRGATVALMILVNNPGNWQHIYSPLEHAAWHGCTPTDLVFPFFLFAVGNAMAFVMPGLEAAGNSIFLKKVFRRALLIFAIGLFLNWAPFVSWNGDHLAFRHWVNPDNPQNGVRILGVLQRIALCYLFASLIIYFLKIRGAFVAAAVLLLGYWVLCMLANPTDPYSLAGWFGTHVDKAILGIPHMYKGEGIPFDPEGLMSTLPAIAQVIFGYLAGNYIIQKGKTFEMCTGLFVTAGVLLFAGFCWHMVFPINKKIWTSSFVVYTTGLALFVLAILIYLIEMKGWKSWITRFFDAFGKNPLFIFFLSGFLPRILALMRWKDHTAPDGKPVYTSLLPWFYEHVCKNISVNLNNGSLLYA